MCKSAQDLSQELASVWLSTYMLRCDAADARVSGIVDYFSDYDRHKSHGRSIDREQARALGLKVVKLEDIPDITGLVRSLYNQYEHFFQKTPFYKLYENAHGINWGRQAKEITFQLPIAVPRQVPVPVPQPGSPKDSSQP